MSYSRGNGSGCWASGGCTPISAWHDVVELLDHGVWVVRR
jgi:hypothetical protein